MRKKDLVEEVEYLKSRVKGLEQRSIGVKDKMRWESTRINGVEARLDAIEFPPPPPRQKKWTFRFPDGKTLTHTTDESQDLFDVQTIVIPSTKGERRVDLRSAIDRKYEWVTTE